MKQLKRLDAGQFNRQLTIQNIIETPDGLGGFSKAYHPTDAVWAHICPIGAKRELKADNAINEVTHKILMRFRNSIEVGTKFVTGSRTFLVMTMRDPDESNRYLECMVVEQT